MASNEPAIQRLKPGDGGKDSTQIGCTSWLIISCVVLASTTAFVFGWGLGAPNMYNHYTEPFLKGQDPCQVDQAAQNKTLASPVMNIQAITDGSIAENAEQRRNENGEVIEAEPKSRTSPLKEPFKFGQELIKGIPQTIFLIGAFIGAITGPFWVKLFDRKRTVFANYIFCFASSLCVLLAYYFRQTWLFYLSRLLLGYQGKE
jgi:MFS family permease